MEVIISIHSPVFLINLISCFFDLVSDQIITQISDRIITQTDQIHFLWPIINVLAYAKHQNILLIERNKKAASTLTYKMFHSAAALICDL